MSSEQAGAIIRIIFYILKLDRKIDNYFTPSYLSDRYNKLLQKSPHAEKIKEIIKAFKKHSGKKRIKTLEEESQLRQWLNKHTNIKPIFWFIKSNDTFKLKTESIECLCNLMKKYKI
jgi:hypothetical protein